MSFFFFPDGGGWQWAVGSYFIFYFLTSGGGWWKWVWVWVWAAKKRW